MSGKKTESPRRKYDEEFKRDVVKMLSTGRSVQDVSQSLGINSNMVHRWKAEQAGAGGATRSLLEVAIAAVSGA